MHTQKENKDKHRECEDTKRDMMRIQQELNYNRYLLEERDKMIQVISFFCFERSSYFHIFSQIIWATRNMD